MDSGSDPLLPVDRSVQNQIPVISAVDYRGNPASRSSTGGWSSALFIMGVEVAERFAFYGISSNLIIYLTGPLGESTAAAAAAVNTWSGAALMLPLLGAAVADLWLGPYRTIVVASVIYILALGMLTVSSVLPSFSNATNTRVSSKSSLQIIAFYFSLYLVAFAQGGHKPCTQAFGADQFDPNDPKETLSRASFFNWWYFGICVGATVTAVIVSYVQENIGWALGFGIPCIVMLLDLLLFLLGTRTYRYKISDNANLFAQIGKGFKALRSQGLQGGGEIQDCNTLIDNNQYSNNEKVAEEMKGLLRLFPIWAMCLMYGVVYNQSSTFFVKQAATLDRRIGSSFQVPSAALQCFIGVAVIVIVPIYDRILVPLVRKFTHIPSGITMLQRIGMGMAISLISMVTAALVEMKRLGIANDSGLVDQPEVPLPMSLWWMIPQFILFGVADVFTLVGLQEFFYDQVPDALRSLGIGLYLSTIGVGSFISSILIYVINMVTEKNGQSWFSSNLNRAHLDYFYWLLAALSAIEFLIYVYFARSYTGKKR